jgi:flavorubredoxin
MMKTYKATPDIDVITSAFPLPGMGQVAINAFVIKGTEPILVDAGSVVESAEFMRALRSVIDPAELRWIWLTHTDFDHFGSLHLLLAEYPHIRVITSMQSVGLMGLSNPLPMERVTPIGPGQKIDIGNHTLTAVKPPIFDSAATLGFIDENSGVLFSSDCFGALLPEIPESACDISDKNLKEGQVIWATLDSPWVHKVDAAAFESELSLMSDMAPSMILSSHLPPAPGEMINRMLGALAAAPTARPFTGPDQAALEQMMAQMSKGASK